MSMVRMESAGENVPRTVMGDVRENVWTIIADPNHDAIGQTRRVRNVHFAFREEALDWIAKQEEEGWSHLHGPTPCATTYFGPTDSESNCWSCQVERLS